LLLFWSASLHEGHLAVTVTVDANSLFAENWLLTLPNEFFVWVASKNLAGTCQLFFTSLNTFC